MMKNINVSRKILVLVGLMILSGCTTDITSSSSSESSDNVTSSLSDSSEENTSIEPSSEDVESSSEDVSTSTPDSSSEGSSSEITPLIDWSGFNNYYVSLNSSNDEIGDLARILRSTLTYRTYGDARYNYAVDSKTGMQYVLYETTGKQVPLTWGTGGVITLDSGSYKIEREHIWPQSNMQIRPVGSLSAVNTFPTFELDSDSTFYKKGVSNTSKGHTTDWHNLWNSVGSWNGSHGNRFYSAPDYDFSQVSPGIVTGGWYPGAEFIGDVARAAFYMTLTYPFLTLADKGSGKSEGSIYYGHLDYLLKWNEMDPVSPEEIDRNNKIFAGQGNRNPFIDLYDQNIADFIFSNGDPEIPQ